MNTQRSGEASAFDRWVSAHTVNVRGLLFCALESLARKHTVGRVRLLSVYRRRLVHHPAVLFVQHIEASSGFVSSGVWGVLVVDDLSAVDWAMEWGYNTNR